MKRLLPLLCLAACTPETPVEDGPQEPVVVYAAFDEDPALTSLFAQYTDSTGVAIINRHGDPRAIVDDVIRNDVNPPADVLMTTSAVDVWRAAEESALRPLYSDALEARVPGWARDVDDLWFATAADVAVIASRDGEIPDTFEALGEEPVADKLCLSSSRLEINRAVIAMMIAESGVREAELAVRGWMQNLAQPIFASEEDLAAAIAAGTCDFGILSRSVADSSGGLEYVHPDLSIATVDAIGVGRHARNPDGAARLIEWLAYELAEIALNGPPPVDSSSAAWNDEVAQKLAERARYY